MTEFTHKPTTDWFWVDLDTGAKVTAGGIHILDDDMKERGIRARDGVVVAVNDKTSEYVSVGDTVILEHLGWARAMVVNTADGESKKIWPTKLEKVLLHRKAEQ